MDNSTRLQYLDAMGVDVWVSRASLPQEQYSNIDEANVSAIAQVNRATDSIDDDWYSLQQQVEQCHQCALSETRARTVFGEGDMKADWMLIGEAPSQTENQEGKPFLGQSGFLLTEMLRAIGLNRETAYITNIVKCSPPNNKDPKVDELKSCHGFLQRQITLLKPKIILAVGRVAAHSLLGTKKPLSELRGIVHHVNEIPVVVVYHPAYLLRSLLEKRKAWQDLQLALKTYQQEK